MLHTQHGESNPILKLSFGRRIVGCCHSSGSEHASMFTFSPLGAGFDLMNVVHVKLYFFSKEIFMKSKLSLNTIDMQFI